MPTELDRELTHLRRSILAMAADVQQRVARAIRSLIEEDAAAAREVRTSDAEIDRMDVDVEAECMRILALSQPVARDLRFVLAVLRIDTDLERIGDMAKSIAKRVLDLQEQVPVEIPPPLREMAASTIRQLDDAITALSEEDVELARRVCRSDEQVDRLEQDVIHWIQHEIPRHVEVTNAVIDLFSISRQLERIGDHATNIAEDVVFFVEGAIIRHVRV